MAAAHHPSAGDRSLALMPISAANAASSCRRSGASRISNLSLMRQKCRGKQPYAQRTKRRLALLAQRLVTAYSIPRRKLRRLATLAGRGRRSGRSAAISSRASRNSFSASFKAARAFLMRAGLIDPFMSLSPLPPGSSRRATILPIGFPTPIAGKIGDVENARSA